MPQQWSIAESRVKNIWGKLEAKKTKRTEMSRRRSSIIKFMQNNRKQATYNQNTKKCSKVCATISPTQDT